MYFVALRGEFTQEASRDVQTLVHSRGGFILMVTRNGLVIALDDSYASIVSAHSQVRAIGGVSLNPRGFARDRLERIFAQNLSKQLDLSKLGKRVK